VHAAGVLDDATLAHLDAERLERVLAPKVDGARHLDEATATDPLDFFVLFSSAAALVGNPGQAAYAAANTYLDGLAAARRRRGLPALSVQWGPFLDIGLAAADERRGARLADRGMAALAADSAWAALLELMRGDAPVVSYVALDARRWLDAYPDAAAQPVWRPLLAASHPSASTGSAPGLLAALRERPEPERQLLAERAVRDLVSRVLRLELSERDRETPFKALGLDSLLGIELRNRVESAFGVHLPSTVLWTYGSSRALASALCERASAAS
jgi:phthiocerol/phenolphthiocerol synthesis type-I polyketide synthase C